MDAAKIKRLFARFENLNLFVLIADLRGKSCAYASWIDGRHSCPIAHGFRNGTVNYADDDEQIYLHAGIPKTEWAAATQFIGWWDDGAFDNVDSFLFEVLEEIAAERMADADAVQAVIAGAPERELIHA